MRVFELRPKSADRCVSIEVSPVGEAGQGLRRGVSLPRAATGETVTTADTSPDAPIRANPQNRFHLPGAGDCLGNSPGLRRVPAPVAFLQPMFDSVIVWLHCNLPNVVGNHHDGYHLDVRKREKETVLSCQESI